MSTVATMPDWVKFGAGPLLTFLAFLPVFRMRIKRVEDDVKEAKDIKTGVSELTSAMTALTQVVTEQTRSNAASNTELIKSNVEVKNTLFEVKRMYESLEKYEGKNSAEHKEIRKDLSDNYMSKTTHAIIEGNRG